MWKVLDRENKRLAGVVTGCDDHLNCFIYSSVDDLWSVNVRRESPCEKMQQGDYYRN